MDRPKIKTFFILLLLLVNLVFAGVYALDLLDASADSDNEVNGIRGAFENVGIAVKCEIPRGVKYRSVAVTASQTAQKAFAEAALGSSVAEDKGGGITVYSSGAGEAFFMPDGRFEINLVGYRASEPQENRAVRLAKALGLKVTPPERDGSSLSCSVLRDGMNVFNQSLSFEFGGSGGVRVSGVYVTGTEVVSLKRDSFDEVSAAMRFLHNIELNGVLCSEVTRIEPGYVFEGNEYLPAWRLVTDAGEFVIT